MWHSGSAHSLLGPGGKGKGGGDQEGERDATEAANPNLILWGAAAA
jgi:hypothetical protein